MTDKEVGELWRDWEQVHRHNLIEPIDEDELKISAGVIALIRKLVEERASHWDDDIGAAVESFGIDPAKWPKE